MEIEKIGLLIAEMRKEKGLTQKALSEIINVDSKTISKWEQGISAPDITLLKKISETLGITIDELVEGKRNNKNKKIQNLYIFIFENH